jgi:hypothetical protein
LEEVVREVVGLGVVVKERVEAKEEAETAVGVLVGVVKVVEATEQEMVENWGGGGGGGVAGGLAGNGGGGGLRELGPRGGHA